MTRHFFISAALALTALAASSCQGDKPASTATGPQFTLSGTISGANGQNAVLSHRSLSGLVAIDSVQIGADGAFTLHAPAPVGGPELYMLKVGDQTVNIAVDSTEAITLKGQMPGLSANYTVAGSHQSELIRTLSLQHMQLQHEVTAVEHALVGPALVDSLSRMLTHYKERLCTEYIYAEPQSVAAYYAISETLNHIYWEPSHIFVLGDSTDNRAFRAVATCWKEYYPESERATQFYNMVEEEITRARIARERARQLSEEKLTVADIIDLSLPDIYGHEHKLSDLRGQVVLLDFHAFMHPESGARIIALRELYDKYHDRGLEIYQVSIDEDEHLWKQAVEQLPWVSVRDADGRSLSRYNVRELPEFFTIGRNNDLQKRSSQIEDLEKEIERLL